MQAKGTREEKNQHTQQQQTSDPQTFNDYLFKSMMWCQFALFFLSLSLF